MYGVILLIMAVGFIGFIVGYVIGFEDNIEDTIFERDIVKTVIDEMNGRGFDGRKM